MPAMTTFYTPRNITPSTTSSISFSNKENKMRGEIASVHHIKNTSTEFSHSPSGIKNNSADVHKKSSSNLLFFCLKSIGNKITGLQLHSKLSNFSHTVSQTAAKKFDSLLTQIKDAMSSRALFSNEKTAAVNQPVHYNHTKINSAINNILTTLDHFVDETKLDPLKSFAHYASIQQIAEDLSRGSEAGKPFGELASTLIDLSIELKNILESSSESKNSLSLIRALPLINDNLKTVLSHLKNHTLLSTAESQSNALPASMLNRPLPAPPLERIYSNEPTKIYSNHIYEEIDEITSDVENEYIYAEREADPIYDEIDDHHFYQPMTARMPASDKQTVNQPQADSALYDQLVFDTSDHQNTRMK